MNHSISVFDNFYSDPDKVREYALGLEYNVVGNYPGKRSSEQLGDNHNLGVKKFFRDYFERDILNWSNGYNGSFQYVLENEITWIHKDKNEYNTHAALIFLHPNPPEGDYGTTLFEHKETKSYFCPDDETLIQRIENDGQNLSKWSIMDYVGYRYNRLILYDSQIIQNVPPH